MAVIKGPKECPKERKGPVEPADTTFLFSSFFLEESEDSNERKKKKKEVMSADKRLPL